MRTATVCLQAAITEAKQSARSEQVLHRYRLIQDFLHYGLTIIVCCIKSRTV